MNEEGEIEMEKEVETIESLTKEIDELSGEYFSEKDAMERFMLETGGESDASARMQKNLDFLDAEISAAESRLQALLDEQEKLEDKKEVETIGSLTEKSDELSKKIQIEKNRLERFMRGAGGESDESKRMQKNIDNLQNEYTEVNNRLQALFDEQEKLAFAPKEKSRVEQKSTTGRASVIKKLEENKAEIEVRKRHESHEKGKESHEKGKERKSPENCR